MLAFVFLFLTVAAFAAPQGVYNYRVDVGGNSRNQFTQEQYQTLQHKISEQHQQPQREATQVSQVSQTVSRGSEREGGIGYHFANQLVQQAQLAHYEHEHEQQQQPQPQLQQTQEQLHVEPVLTATPQRQQFQAPEQLKQEEPHIKNVIVSQLQPLQQQQYEARHQSAPQARKSVQYNKEFFYLSAPQEDFIQPKELDQQLESLRRNIRVIFIRGPEHNNLANAAVQLAKQSMEQQTIVYVLTKQHDAAELAHKLNQVHAGTHTKPDVVFIKYRTPAEAAHAQRTIQAQYEQLEGPNHFNHEGVAPTHNFVGFTGTRIAASGSDVQIDPRKKSSKVNEAVEAPSSNYLPAIAKS